MKKLLLLILILIVSPNLGVNAQTYVSGSFSYYDGAGTFQQNAMATVEVGKTINNVFNLNVAAGVTSFSAGKAYLETRPTITVWSKNNFSVSGTLGAGYVFDSPESFLSEYSGAISYTFKSNLALSVSAGGYKFSGRTSSSIYTFSGLGLTYVFQ